MTEPPPLPALEELFRPLAQARAVLLAVSGGPDSTALMHLAAGWSATCPATPLFVASVDHGLRAESTAEADFVLAEAETLGLPAVKLTWDGPKPERAVQERAREARYDLLCGHAEAVGADTLVTAHTLDDQAETLLFRMARGSGLHGLAGMATVSDRQGLRHVRPLLDVAKATLLKACRDEGWAFLEDPSNRSTRFARVRWRRLMPDLAAEGLDASRLGQLAKRLARADAAIERSVDAAAAATVVRNSPDGHAIDFGALSTHADEIVLRVLARSLAVIGGPGLRMERLESLVATLRTAQQSALPLSRTLGHCQVVLDRDGRLRVTAETAPRRRGLNGRQACCGEVARVPLATPQQHHTLPNSAAPGASRRMRSP